MAKSSQDTANRKEAYQQLDNDSLAAVYMQLDADFRRIQSNMALIKGIAQNRMEAAKVRILPTDGPIRIKGALWPDLPQSEFEKGMRTGGLRGMLIKRVGFEYKEVVALHTAANQDNKAAREEGQERTWDLHGTFPLTRLPEEARRVLPKTKGGTQ